MVITDVFDTNEIRELKGLIEIYDKSLKEIYKNENLEEAYCTYLESLRYNNDHEDFWRKMDLLQPATDSAMLYLKKCEFFEKAFYYNYGYRGGSHMKDTTIIFIDPILYGLYDKFLESMSLIDPRFVGYKEAVKASGTIPPTSDIFFTMIDNDLDIDRESYRLAIAFHYLILLSPKDFKTKANH